MLGLKNSRPDTVGRRPGDVARRAALVVVAVVPVSCGSREDGTPAVESEDSDDEGEAMDEPEAVTADVGAVGDSESPGGGGEEDEG